MMSGENETQDVPVPNGSEIGTEEILPKSKVTSMSNDHEKVQVSGNEIVNNTELTSSETNEKSNNEENDQVNVQTNNENSTINETGDSKDEDSKEEEYVDILGNGQLKKKVLVQGKGKDSRPLQGDIVTLNIEGQLQDGTTVDKYSGFSFAVGEGDVVQAWDLAVSLMELGETCEVITGEKYAYGEKGRDPDIPPKSEITYTLELLEHKNKPELDTISVQEKLDMGEQKRERGNLLFSRQEYTGAINSYTKAIKILDYPGNNSNIDHSLLQEIIDNKIKCCNNLAACQLKVEAYDAVIRSCQMVLTTQPENVKALFRTGKAHAAKRNTNEAIAYFKKALKLEPESKIVHQELSRLTKKLQSETESEKKMYRRMLGTTDSKNSDGNKKNGSWWIRWTLLAGGLAVAGVSILAAFRFGNH